RLESPTDSAKALPYARARRLDTRKKGPVGSAQRRPHALAGPAAAASPGARRGPVRPLLPADPSARRRKRLSAGGGAGAHARGGAGAAPAGRVPAGVRALRDDAAARPLGRGPYAAQARRRIQSAALQRQRL